MISPESILFMGLGIVAGAATMWAIVRTKLATLSLQSLLHEEQALTLSAKLSEAQENLTAAREEISRQRERVAHYEARIREQAETFASLESKLTTTFKALSSESLKSTTEQFSAHFNATARALLEQVNGHARVQVDSGHKLLDSIGRTIWDKLNEVDKSVREIEKLRISGDAELRKQIEHLSSLNQFIGSETSKLSQALTNSRIQGVWGELQLRNVVEAAGMTPFCDFFTQESSTTGDGDGVRPDMRVRLPNNLNVLIDAKSPTKAFIEALGATDSNLRRAKMKELTTALRGHIRTMAKRNYPAHFAPSLEYTLVFLPSESLFVAAVEEDKDLLSFAEHNKVILTTPLSLIAFLRAVACGWTNVKVQSNAEEIQRLGRELFERMNRFFDRLGALGKGLEGVVKTYNDAAATGRTLTTTRRKFAELGTGDPTLITSPDEIATEVRVTDKTSEELRQIAHRQSAPTAEDLSQA
ncbi:MAG: recombination protein RmuC [Pseudomonadota bacterium]